MAQNHCLNEFNISKYDLNSAFLINNSDTSQITDSYFWLVFKNVSIERKCWFISMDKFISCSERKKHKPAYTHLFRYQKMNTAVINSNHHFADIGTILNE